LLLARKLLNQGFILVKLKSLLRKCCDRHHDLVRISKCIGVIKVHGSFHEWRCKIWKPLHNLTKMNPWFSSFLASSNPISRKSRYEPQAMDYRFN
jgi:hypothetical protein